ncbi:MAG: phosphatase PAP2 family protein [Muribaculaceae bacterium]|nr:phosphatase PAP2 family protein [Muribaculaceae bacterium]
MFEVIDSFDTELLIFLNSFRGNFWDIFLAHFSGKYVWVPLYASLIYLFFKNYNWKQSIIFILAIVLTVLLADQTCSHIIRPLVQRLRPAHPENPISEFIFTVEGHVPGGRFGFPSCHAANSFALAILVTLIIRNLWLSIFFFFWAIINSYSRIYLAAHYPGDLIVGALVGLFYGVLISMVVTSLTRQSKRETKHNQGAIPIVIYTGLLTMVIFAIISL